MALEELMLVNPKGKYPRRKSLQIVFPKPVKHMKVNPSAIDRVKEAGKGLMGDVTLKEVAGGVGGVASTVLIPQYLKLKGWKDVVGSGAVAVGGGLLVRQADKGAEISVSPEPYLSKHICYFYAFMQACYTICPTGIRRFQSIYLENTTSES